MTIKQALISVSDKTGVLEFAQGLAAQGVKLLLRDSLGKLLQDLPATIIDQVLAPGRPRQGADPGELGERPTDAVHIHGLSRSKDHGSLLGSQSHYSRSQCR